MTSLKEKRKADLWSAWKLICQWIKNNASGKFAGGKRFNCPHHVYYWTDLVITESGDARIYHGNHSSHCPTYIVTENNIYDPPCPGSVAGGLYGDNLSESEIAARSRLVINWFRDDEFNEIITLWPVFKQLIIMEIAKIEALANFEP